MLTLILRKIGIPLYYNTYESEVLVLNKELIKGSTITLILNTLEKQPMYGYGMIK